MLRYSLLRLLIFFACLLVFWLLGLRGETNVPYLVVAAALTSMVISYFALARMRNQFSDQVAHRIEERTKVKRAKQVDREEKGETDEAAEDAKVEDGFR